MSLCRTHRVSPPSPVPHNHQQHHRVRLHSIITSSIASVPVSGWIHLPSIARHIPPRTLVLFPAINRLLLPSPRARRPQPTDRCPRLHCHDEIARFGNSGPCQGNLIDFIPCYTTGQHKQFFQGLHGRNFPSWPIVHLVPFQISPSPERSSARQTLNPALPTPVPTRQSPLSWEHMDGAAASPREGKSTIYFGFTGMLSTPR